MNFLDRTGHIFSLDSYDQYPIGYEYQENPYIFWFESERGYKLSVDNYYFKPIRIVTRLFDKSPDNKINVKIENSNKFFLVGSKIIEEKFMNINDINDPISLDEDFIKNSKELNYSANITFDVDNITINEEDGNDFNSLITKENEVMVGYETFYVKYNTYTPVKDEDIIDCESLVGESYLDIHSNLVPITEDTHGIKVAKDIIGDSEKYVILIEKKKKVKIDETNQNSNKITDIHNDFELYLISTFYVLVNSDEEGVWSTNIIINVNEDYCPITVAAEIVDEREELVINGQNMGIKLPKEIVNAIYSSNINSVIPDNKLYNLKMKEYLLNYMALRGEVGNYKSALDALKWFEWDDKLTISKLIKNDNRIQKQYVKDFFNILNDNIYSYQLFKETALLSLEFNLTEDGDKEDQNMDEYFWGEGKPNVISKLDSKKEIYYDEKEFPYLRGYFDYTYSDLGLKLCFLKYYYEKYFLPLHIRIHNISLNHKVYSNDIKLINRVSHGITATPIYINTSLDDKEYYSSTDNIVENISGEENVIFNNGYNIVYFNREYKKNKNLDYSDNNKLFIDTNYNEFSNYTLDFVENDDNIYFEVNDTCLRIPIDLKNDTYYDIQLIFSRYIDKNNDSMINNDDSSNLFELFKTSFKFIQTENNKYQGIVLYPKQIRERFDSSKFDSVYWLNNIFRIDLVVNGKLYNFVFTVKMPEFNIELGKLVYKYDTNFRQVKSLANNELSLNAFMYSPNLVTVNNYNFNEEIINLSNNLSNYVNTYYKESVKFLNKKYLNICHLLQLTDNSGEEIRYTGPQEPITWESLNGFISTNNSSIDLYKNFFKEDGSYNFDSKILKINKNLYDLYLMHDYEYWYIVLISKEPIDYNTISDKNFSFYNGAKTIKINDYTLKYQRSDRKFLLNRYIYLPTNGENHFSKDDIIVSSLKMNDKLPFKLSSGSKWVISPMSLRMRTSYNIKSNTELAILSIYNDLPEYEKGYYSISVNYSVDDYVQHTYTKQAIFRID